MDALKALTQKGFKSLLKSVKIKLAIEKHSVLKRVRDTGSRLDKIMRSFILKREECPPFLFYLPKRALNS